ncbi:hypothetical protein B0J14DRAFT_571540 [Halenospora varia]|nr:hypothetical protein B0J14DRAFT_571540 [Halenospora varia]
MDLLLDVDGASTLLLLCRASSSAELACLHIAAHKTFTSYIPVELHRWALRHHKVRKQLCEVNWTHQGCTGYGVTLEQLSTIAIFESVGDGLVIVHFPGAATT